MSVLLPAPFGPSRPKTSPSGTENRIPSRARDHHLRRAYALADLYERSGAEPRARELFIWVRNHDARFADVAARVRALS